MKPISYRQEMENTEEICTPEPHRVPLSFNLGNWPTVTVIFQFSSVAQSCPALCDPMDCSTPGFPVHVSSTQRWFKFQD